MTRGVSIMAATEAAAPATATAATVAATATATAIATTTATGAVLLPARCCTTQATPAPGLLVLVAVAVDEMDGKRASVVLM